jgi:PE family
MSSLIAAPELITTAATDLANIGSTLTAPHLTAAAPTVALAPAAGDEVSAGIAQLFSQHAANYQAVAGQAAAFNDQFVQHLTASAGSFAHAEAANAAVLQPLTAGAASIGSAIGALSGQLLNLLNSANAAFLNSVNTFAIRGFVILGFFFVIAILGLTIFGLTHPQLILANIPLLLNGFWAFNGLIAPA